MKRRRKWLGLGTLVVALLMTSPVLVQAAPGRQGSGGACDVEHLVAEQSEYAALLANFQHAVEHDLEAALSALYEVGHAYQHLAEECGFAPPEDAHADMADDHMDDDRAGDMHEAGDEHEADEHGDAQEHEDEVEHSDLTELALSIGDPANGEALFNTLQPEVGFACANCHRVDSAERLVGPGLRGIASPEHDHAEHGVAEAGETEEMSETDMAMETLRRTDPATYIRLSILSPNTYVVPGFLAGLMPQNYGQVFTPEEINDLVAYVLTLSE